MTGRGTVAPKWPNARPTKKTAAVPSETPRNDRLPSHDPRARMAKRTSICSVRSALISGDLIGDEAVDVKWGRRRIDESGALVG